MIATQGTMRALVEDYDVPPMPDASARGPDVTASWITPEHLSAPHLAALVRAVSNVLSTEPAEFAFAQIIDGLPTADSFVEFRPFYPATRDEHPVAKHARLCDGALDAARQALGGTLNPLALRFDPRVLQGFQDEQEGSRPFLLRLLELVAVSIHQLAADAYEAGDAQPSLHRSEYESWWASWRERHEDATGIDKLDAVAFPPVPFYHDCYHRHFDQFPRGKADIVGYWAEAKILGGVALFDRGPSELECIELLIHGSLYKGPFTIYPPTAAQWNALVAFLTWDPTATTPEHASSPPPCPLPLRATRDNVPRYTPYFAMKYQHIFRDRFAFRLPERFEQPHHRTLTEVNYPEREDYLWVVLRLGEKASGASLPAADEDELQRRIEVLRACQPGSPYSYAPWPDEILQGEGMSLGGR
ncbi:putative AC transposase [Purpureocillium lavendulum]|uniref:AC transposase n=1 Tax=Purpureocillium lavendulum TaxID=1247861 RepID=A0AB34FXR1_9HYPO|nr:putative AC transposase [Purpureocillium lavendulum]